MPPKKGAMNPALAMWYAFWTWFHPHWIRFLLFFLGGVAKPPTRANHNVTIIGDGVAMGVGDYWVAIGGGAGIANRIKWLIARRRKIRTKWEYFNSGEVLSTSADWLPGKKLFDKCFSKGVRGCGKKSEVIVLMIGTQDILKGEVGMPEEVLKRPIPAPGEFYKEEELCQTVKNIRDTIRVLLETDPRRRVLLCDIMSGNGFRLDSEFAHVYDCVNKQIIDLTKAKNPLAVGPYDFGDRFPKWVHMSPPKVVGKRNVKCSDGVHLNSKGYKGISDWVAADIEQAMLQVEFTYLKGMIG
mmetsp:Transcript_14089/g.32792  ORF Transcript_14089/g.32792 Transcript_14089/m.32792 type:complete len:298 (-) Transcript_14089:28-921(-)